MISKGVKRIGSLYNKSKITEYISELKYKALCK